MTTAQKKRANKLRATYRRIEKMEEAERNKRYAEEQALEVSMKKRLPAALERIAAALEHKNNVYDKTMKAIPNAFNIMIDMAGFQPKQAAAFKKLLKQAFS